ncbi:MAG TPA: DUF6089 family protein [Bacteroidales bacterium]|nr:DUF6089 family protein [Bacteroidales bacterium]
MRIYFFIILIFVPVVLSAQHRADYGITGGVSSYMGDINPDRLMYSPGPSGGVFYRYNLNPRQALRANILAGLLSANDHDFNNSFQQARARSFSGFVGEFSVMYEFNFFPYNTIGKLYDYTPYLAGGAGIAFDGSSVAFLPVIPFSLGFKINLFKNLGMEAEYGFRKTFYDNFDGLKDLVSPEDYALTHNNDWYTYTGISFTWKIMSRLAGCPAYGDADSKRRR